MSCSTGGLLGTLVVRTTQRSHRLTHLTPKNRDTLTLRPTVAPLALAFAAPASVWISLRCAYWGAFREGAMLGVGAGPAVLCAPSLLMNKL